MTMWHRWALGLILLSALGVRVGWVLSRPIDDASIDQLPDQREYLEIAKGLRAGEGFGFVDQRFNDRVLAHRTPGYPFFIVACNADVRLVRLAQCLLDTSTALAAYLLARRWLSPAAGVLASALVAFNPFLIYFCGLILTETLFTALLAWGMVLLTSARTLPWLIGGVVLSASVLVRPGAIAMPVLLAVLAALTNRHARTPYQRKWPIPVGATMLVITAMVLFPWALRNKRVLGQWVWTSTNAGITSYDGFNPNATGASDQSFVKTMPQLRVMNELARNEYLAERAKLFRHQYPRRSLELAGVKVARTWSPRPLSDQFSSPLYVWGALAFAVPFDLLFLIGLFRGKLPLTVKLFLTAPAIYLTLASAMSVGSLRYRIPAEVPMAVVAAGVVPLFARTKPPDAGLTPD